MNENTELEELIRNATGGVATPPAAPFSNSADGDDDEASGLDLSTLVLVARRSLLWLLLLIALGITASWLYLRYTKPVYQSASLLKIDERAQADALGLTGQMAPVADKARGSKLAGEVELIKSGLIYRRLKDTLALDVNYYVQGTVLEAEMYGISPFRVQYVVKDPSFYNRKFNLKFVDAQKFVLEYNATGRSINGEYTLGKPVVLPGITLTVSETPQLTPAAREEDYHFTIQDEGTVNSYLDRNLAVEIVNPDANTIQISFKDFNPNKAQSIVNKIDTVYLQEKLARKKESTEASLRFLEQTLNETQNSLQKAEDNLQQFTESTKTSNVESDMSAIAEKMEKMEEDRPKLEQKMSLLAEISQLANRESITNSETETVEQTLPGLAGIDDPQLSQALTELNNKQWYLVRLLRSQTERTEGVQRAIAELAYTRRNIKRLLIQDQRLVRRQLELLDQQRAKMNAQLERMPEIATKLSRLKRPLDQYSKNYDMLFGRKIDFNIQKAGSIADFQILSPASPPGAPISPNRLLVYAVGLAGGLILGLGLIALRYFMHNTVTNVRELERSTKASVLGIIPTYDKEKMEVSRLVVDKNPKSAISESIRSIRTNLDFISSAKKKAADFSNVDYFGRGQNFRNGESGRYHRVVGPEGDYPRPGYAKTQSESGFRGRKHQRGKHHPYRAT